MGRFIGASASLRKSFADVTRRKGRALLVVLGIFIGIFGLTAINTAEDALFAALTFSQSGQATQPDIMLIVDHLDPALLPTLQSTTDVETVQYQTAFHTQWHVSQAPGHIAMQITSYPDLHHVPLTPFQLTSGRYPNAGEIVMEYGDLGLQRFSIGDTVTVNTAQGTANLRVVGLARTPGHNPATAGSGEGYMSDAGLQQITSGVSVGPKRGINASISLDPEIAVKVQNHTNTVAMALHQLLLAHGIAVYGLITFGQTPPPTNAIAGVFSLLRILAIVAVVMSGFLILNTVTTLVAEQAAIIGTMKAAGGTRGAIMRGYLVSVGIYSLLATLPALVLGLLGGYALSTWLATTVPIDVGPFVLQWWIVIVGLAFGFGVPLLAALLPLWNGTRISVRDALAAYGVSAGNGNGPMARLGRRLTWISQTVSLGLRGVFRRRWRAALTLLTLTLAAASFLVVQVASASVAHAVGSVNANIAADVEVDTNQPLSMAQLRSQVGAESNVQRVERYGPDQNVTTRWGQVQLMAFDPDTQVYRYHMTSGRWLASGETDTAVLSDEALARTGLHIGDTLMISDQGNHETLRIIGTVKQSIYDFGGIGAIITSIAAYNQFTGVPAGAGGDASLAFLVQARDHSPSAVSQLTNDLDGLLNQGQSQNCTQVCGGGAAVTLLSAETTQHQQSWFVLYALLYAVALIVGAVGVLGLANALTASVLERRREIGMLRAMGASSWRVGQVFWSEGLALGGITWLVGGVVGLPLAYLFVRAFSQLVMPVDFVIDPAAFVVMLVAVVVIATLATIPPASRAAQIRVADMLRYD